jgi:hypothetical protein
MNTNQHVKETYNKYSELNEKWHDQFSNWVKTIVVTTTGLLSILISLKQHKSDNIVEHILFSVTIIGLTLGILSGVILLHRQINLIGKLRKWTHERLAELMFDNDNKIKVDFLKPDKIYKFSEYIFYVALITAILALTIYAVIKDY